MPPVLSWPALAEITFGAMLQGNLNPRTVKPESFPEPYLRGVKLLREKKAPTPEKVIEVVGLAAYQASYRAAEAMADLPANWITLLEVAAQNHALGLYVERVAAKLKNGEAVDWGPIQKAIRRTEDGLPQAVRMDLVKLKEGDNDYTKTGYEPLDKWVGGLPTSYITLVIGPPGTGKTYLWLEIAAAFARRRKKSILFSLEMTAQSLARRALRQMKLPKEVAKYIYIVDDILSPSDIAAISARTEGADLVGVDFAELMMLQGERTEGLMADAYLTLNASAKNLGIPHLILGQMTKLSLIDLIPTMGAARYTGMADILAGLEIGLVTRHQVLRKADMAAEANVILPLAPGNGAQVVIKARFGTTKKEVGAIEVPFNPDTGWGKKAVRWHSLGA